ncbi:hypothetical protein [uncultured Methanomethylovorans sp.]|uniref:hypothetical protein n=1 Tax=uncultured Methanomethylovorans sp. TaxID=183759 RepID=UPI002AA79484|nr:hypothetical protein [uncultured Methanomethylovorans sp.]
MVSLILASCLIFVATILASNILSFTAKKFSSSAVSKIQDSCNSRVEIYASEENGSFSLTRVKYVICNIIVEVFRLLDKINNEHLRTGMKLASVVLFILIFIAILFLLVFFTLYFLIFAAVFYILYRLLQMWSRSQRGLSPFGNEEQYTSHPDISYNDRSIASNEGKHKKETDRFSEWDKFLGDQKK